MFQKKAVQKHSAFYEAVPFIRRQHLSWFLVTAVFQEVPTVMECREYVAVKYDVAVGKECEAKLNHLM